MERNAVTTIDKLQTGDRFYKTNDKNKTVFTKVDYGLNKEKYFAVKDGLHWPDPINKTTPVVFLRHADK